MTKKNRRARISTTEITLAEVVEKGKRLKEALERYLKADKEGDALLSKEEIYDRLKETYGERAPDSPAAVDAALRRAGLTPEVTGGRGRGKANRWWYSDVRKTLFSKD